MIDPVAERATGTPKVSATHFREAMARLSAAVHIVTTEGIAGRAGLTMSAVCSVTDDPPTLLVCLNRRSDLNEVVKANGVLAVNTLRADQERLSRMFTGRGGIAMADRFLDDPWDVLATGSPVLRTGLVTFDCRINEINEVGTHSVLFAEVVDVAVHDDGPALVYYRRSYQSVHRPD